MVIGTKIRKQKREGAGQEERTFACRNLKQSSGVEGGE